MLPDQNRTGEKKAASWNRNIREDIQQHKQKNVFGISIPDLCAHGGNFLIC